jgi:hypothetical protein
MRLFRTVFGWMILFLFLLPIAGRAKVIPARYGVLSTPDSVMESRLAEKAIDSLWSAHPQLSNTNIVYATTSRVFFEDQTLDFYLLIILVIWLGCIRLLDPKYFQSLWHAFQNPTLTSRSLKDKLQAASFPNFLMNIFFTISIAAYLFYVVRNFTPHQPGNIPPSLLLVMLIGGMMLVYLGKYLVIRFSGWAFRVEGITDYYLFNVFLINKILAVLLLPFIIIIAFGDVMLARPALIVSFILILILFINRYLRSWNVFGSFFQYSKFHFFMYLCASELLPLAVLMKLLVRGLLY